MAQFVFRLKSQDLAEFSWMFPRAMIQELQSPTSRSSPITFDQEVSQGVITVQMHRHDAWRKKLYDAEVSAPPPSDGITAGVVTLGTLENGSLFARVDNRRGSRAMCYLKGQWKGVSLFFSHRHASTHTR